MKALAVTALALLLLVPRAGAYEESVLLGMEQIREDAIEAHVTFLAHDLLEGRETGTRGYELAANYVAAQFRAFGLEPAGDEGEYLQWFSLRRFRTVPDASRLVLVDGSGRETELVRDVDYIPFDNGVWTASSVDAPLVFVGYGISAPEVGHDDYEGIDAEGKVVVFFRGGPPTLHHNQRAYYATSTNKSRTAVDHGAVGMIQLWTREDEAKRQWDRVVTNSAIASMRWLYPDGSPHNLHPQIEGAAFLSGSGAKAIFGDDLETAYEVGDTGASNSFDLSLRVQMEQESVFEEVRSCNVAGVLPGSNPERAHEMIVYTGHLDHLGVGEALEDGDRIYNGAYDNASGIAVMLEVARVMSLGPGPERSVLFLAVTGEEKGLLGSEYYAEFPTRPMENMIANVNLDMFLMLHPFRDVVAYGAEHSSLAGNVERAGRHLGVEVSPDPIPEEVIFVRSDQYNFVRKGVPAVFLWPGDMGVPEGEPTTMTWLRDVYHSQKDDMNQRFLWKAGANFARMNYLIGMEIAGSSEVPSWNEGDFFGDLFGRGQRAKKMPQN